jgi:L-lactate utilization protein LutC
VHNLASRLAAAPHSLLAGLVWPDPLKVSHGRAQGDDLAGLSVAYCGIAETGSLVMLSGPGSPTTLNFLPDDFICVLDVKRIVPRMEDAWALMREEHLSTPRSVNIITGPSRTADVEQTIQLGAHGPRRLHVVLLRDIP